MFKGQVPQSLPVVFSRADSFDFNRPRFLDITFGSSPSKHCAAEVNQHLWFFFRLKRALKNLRAASLSSPVTDNPQSTL